MARLLSGVALFLVCALAYAQGIVQQEEQSPPDETMLLVWILTGIFVFFAGVGLFTWHLIKSERKRQLEKKPPE